MKIFLVTMTATTFERGAVPGRREFHDLRGIAELIDVVVDGVHATQLNGNRGRRRLMDSFLFSAFVISMISVSTRIKACRAVPYPRIGCDGFLRTTSFNS